MGKKRLTSRTRTWLLLGTVFIIAACTGGAAQQHSSGSDGRARDAAHRFLDAYVDADGRVVRHDQGSDTVSEGQAYALLIAQAAGDDQRFDAVWTWTSTHLQRPDGLLSAHTASDGTVDDKNSASDADVLAAWALVHAGDRHRDDGRRLAAAILDHETVALPDGTMALAAGNWATGQPATLNPSYWALPAYRELARATNDPRWHDLETSAVQMVSTLTDQGHQLPPDWARVDGSSVKATPPANGQVPDVRYSLDAQRTVVWFALAGEPLTASWASMLSGDRARDIALHTDGSVIDANAHALPLVAAASVARSGDRERLLDDAENLDRQFPTYYGAAWVALGRTLLTTDVLRVS